MIRHGRRIVQNRFGVSLPMPVDDKKFVSLPFASGKSGQRSTDDD
jgi:hypothetical protein